MEINLRFAEKADCPRLLELIHELALFEKAPQEVTVTLEEFQDAGFGKDPVWKAFVAEDEDGIHGMALYYVRYSTWKGKRLYLEDFLVTESKRGTGIGKLLFERVIEEARTQKFNGMNWQVLDWNEPAIRFYKKYQADLEADWLNASFTKSKLYEN
ncbi:GNAT family N-acetyltransferase [Pedobacter antarcticus]|uniref:GNAT family acetyltransferase n=2 Tax=Pedobacter antarcticus TaxID=34086 RepID=A0A081PG04_9SPHI|nr:GNAT family N-acetyltransferase [Pedobacter antarcticus]KEQ29627.1 GNAT family acetyltransferase [Pedobacter antarcticus 4BY]SDM60641.1 L-amino acid N-acyltransferase YncA [Pedobacter antarcticus]SFE58837.1 L-amino acid N-acyltransferase YncA [Pedobacter antarcticus]